MSDIRFYIPKDETVPTSMRLKVDGVDVMYERIGGGFRFHIDADKDEDKAMDVAQKIITRIKNEHDEPEHGVSWRTTSLEIEPNDFGFQTVVVWKYRVRDSW